MESTLTFRLFFAILSTLLVLMVTTTNGKPTLPERQYLPETRLPERALSSKRSSSSDEEQLTLLRNLLAKLRAGTEKTTEASSDNKSTEEKKDEHPKPEQDQHQDHPSPPPQQEQPQQQQQQQQRPAVEEKTSHQHHHSRALSEEDMHMRRDGPGDDIVDQLRRLNGDHATAQILERALAKLGTKKEVETGEKEEANEDGDDMSASANEEPPHTDNATPTVDKSQLLATLIKDALASADESKDTHANEASRRLVHQDKITRGRQRSNQAVASRADRLMELRSEQANQERQDDEMMRQQVLGLVENRLMQDIYMADLLEVSVPQLIADVEKKVGAKEEEEEEELRGQRNKDELASNIEWLDNLLAQYDKGRA